MLYLFRRNSYCFGMPPTSSKCIFYVEFLAKMFATFWSSFLNSHVHPPPKKSYMTSTVSAVCVIDWRHGGCLTVFRMLTCSHSHALLMRVCGSGVALASFGGSHVMHFVVDRWGFCQRSLARLCTLATFHDCTIALEHGWANVGAQGVGWGVGGGGANFIFHMDRWAKSFVDEIKIIIWKRHACQICYIEFIEPFHAPWDDNMIRCPLS